MSPTALLRLDGLVTLYLATASTPLIHDAMGAGLLGQMVTPNAGNQLLPDVDWALDNSCFNADRWSETQWEATLARYAGRPRCLFAVVPDVVADAAATDERWHRYAPTVAGYGYTPAYVIQNGCTHIPDDAGAVFVGGDTAYKLAPGTQHLAATARQRGLWTHMGRVNSLRRLQFAYAHDYDSVDGTFLAFGPDLNLPRLLRYLRIADQQPVLS